MSNIKVAVDAVVFGFFNEALHVLLIQIKFGDLRDSWALPGGFVLEDENLESAVLRELKEESGVEINFLEQLFTYGNLDRDPRGRVISIAYYALINPDNQILKADTDAKDVKWFAINNIPSLAFDHNSIIKDAHNRLSNKVKYQPIGFDLLPKKFTFSSLEKLYASLLPDTLDRRNFRKRVLKLGILKELNQSVKQGAGRPAKLFEFDEERYSSLLDEGSDFKIV